MPDLTDLAITGKHEYRAPLSSVYDNSSGVVEHSMYA